MFFEGDASEMAKEEILLTAAGFAELEEELNDLRVNKRAENVQAIKEARSHGGLSENSEYDAARDEQAKIEARIQELEYKLENATILCTNAKFIVKKYAGTTPGLIVSTGNHAMIPGRFYRTITESEKPEGLDKDVIIECDAWVGSRVVLLSGVTIGRSCTVAAGSVVTKSTPPYSIVGGVPAKFIKFKWTIDEILEHEAALYPEEERYSREELETIFTKYNK